MVRYVKAWPLARITYPPAGTLIALDPDIPAAHQKLFFQASSAVAGARWLLDGELVSEESMYAWTPKPGRHRLHLLGPDRQTLDEVTFTVRE